MTKTNDDDNYNVDKDTMIDDEHCEIVMIMGNLVPRVYSAFKMAAERRPWHTPLWYPRWLVWRFRHSYISRDWPKLSSLQNDRLVQLHLLFPLQLKRNYRRLNIPRIVSTIHGN